MFMGQGKKAIPCLIKVLLLEKYFDLTLKNSWKSLNGKI
jgi:hypothetical protein